MKKTNKLIQVKVKGYLIKQFYGAIMFYKLRQGNQYTFAFSYPTHQQRTRWQLRKYAKGLLSYKCQK